MKKQILTLAFVVAATIASYAQGSITLANTVASQLRDGRSSPSSVLAASVRVNVGVFWGNTQDAMQLNPTLGASSTTAPGIITPAGPYVLQGAAELSTVFLQIRVWDASFGTDWAAAKSGGLFGETDIRQVTLAATAGPGTVIWQGATGTNPNRFNPLTLNAGVVPEPSTIALGVLGLGSVLLFRRRK